MKSAHGKVFKYGDNVDTDVIIPARYLNTADPAELAKHCMEDIDKSFIEKVQPGDIMVATKNFGCGSSREHAPIAIRAAGVKLRHCRDVCPHLLSGMPSTSDLPIVECPEASKEIKRRRHRDPWTFSSGIITDETTGRKSSKGQAFPPFMQKIIDAGRPGQLHQRKQRNERKGIRGLRGPASECMDEFYGRNWTSCFASGDQRVPAEKVSDPEA
jgi:3-isopropylmalate/(R)-2-methylmalate dehydratase small subunit